MERERLKAIIKISNISEETSNIICDTIFKIEKGEIPHWIVKALHSLSSEELWQNEFLMRYHIFIDKISQRKWVYAEAVFADKTLELSFYLSESSGFLDILCITSVMSIPLENIEINDPYFGVYTPK